jgi:hypothetical protein
MEEEKMADLHLGWKWKIHKGVSPTGPDTEVAVKYPDGFVTRTKAKYITWEDHEVRYWMLGSDYDEVMKPSSEPMFTPLDNPIPKEIFDPIDPRLTSINKPDTDSLDPGAHYRFHYKKFLSEEDKSLGYTYIKLDPFRICAVYAIEDLGQATIVKKGLRLGTSIKDRKQDLLDIKCAVDRMLEMMDEDSNL